MPTQHIYAEQTVSITELRKNPAQFFKEEPVAVLSINKPAGYMVNPELFEQMINLLAANTKTVESQFRPARARLEAIAKKGEELLLNATEEQLDTFHK